MNVRLVVRANTGVELISKRLFIYTSPPPFFGLTRPLNRFETLLRDKVEHKIR